MDLLNASLDEGSDARRVTGCGSAKAARCREASLERLADGELDLLELGAGLE